MSRAIRTVWQTIICSWVAVTLPSLAAEHNYTVVVSDDLHRVQVTAQLESAMDLRARNGRTRDLSNLTGCNGERLRTLRNRIKATPCVSYTYPLTPLRERWTPTQVLVTSPSAWLWTPKLSPDDLVRINFQYPGHIDVHLPWVRAGSSYLLKQSPESSDGLAIFGELHNSEIAVGDAKLPLSVIGAADHTEKLQRWLSDAANDVWRVAGRFPNNQATVIAADVPGSTGEAVPFGHVIRDGTETVRFFVQAERPLSELSGDWTATHEFAHLLLPYVRDKWISEGFASYYQNVLLARRGTYDEADAWRRLARSFKRARETPRPPSPNGTRDREFWEARMMIYWSGAAIALMADVELRTSSNGTKSLDTALGELSACCLPSPRSWSGRELFAKLDALSEVDVFVPLYEKHADAKGLPPVEKLYPKLGIAPKSGRITLNERAKLAHIRRAIMRWP